MRSEIVATFGAPEDWTEAGSLILRYGDLQLTFGEDGGLWLATIWNVAGRLRLRSKNVDVDWRVSVERCTSLLAGVGLDVTVGHERSPLLIAGSGAYYRAEGIFDDQGSLEKLSLVGCLESAG